MSIVTGSLAGVRESGMGLNGIEALRPFLRDGPLAAMPRKRSTRLLLFDAIAQTFEPGSRYTEPQVNAALEPVYSDYAALRRYLVDEGFVDCGAGEYSRSGGSIPELDNSS